MDDDGRGVPEGSDGGRGDADEAQSAPIEELDLRDGKDVSERDRGDVAAHVPPRRRD